MNAHDDNADAPVDHRLLLTRRSLLIGGLAATALAACSDTTLNSATTTGARPKDTSGTSLQTTPNAQVPKTGSAPGACVLTPELTAGPYYLNAPLVRRDITEGTPGVPVNLRLQVLEYSSCQPLPDVAVDIWQCDASGQYSGFNGNSLAATQAGGTNNKRFLRGVQPTDGEGVATFKTIFPGWYERRAVHIHLSIHVGGARDSNYHGGHVAHTGQVFFTEDLTARLMRLEPYRAHRGTRTPNTLDSIFSRAGATAIAAMTATDPANPAKGFIGTLTCVVDHNATPPPALLF